jgi:hypothetical protein
MREHIDDGVADRQHVELHLWHAAPLEESRPPSGAEAGLQI